MREYPRFVNPAEIVVETQDRDELRSLWMSDISKGGMFVRTESPPQMRARVKVQISTPEGALELDSEVVHVLTPAEALAYGRPAGVGLQFVDLHGEKKAAIERYVDGIAMALAAATPAPTADLDRDALMTDAQILLSGFEGDDLYGALSVEPLASTAEIAQRIKFLLERFSTRRTDLRPAQHARVHHARSLVKKIAVLMLDEDRRLEHDFRHGLALVEERLATFPTAQEVAGWRAIWHRVFTENWQEGAVWAAEALKAEHELDYARAVECGKTALGLDPFNPELRVAIHGWEKWARPKTSAPQASADHPA
jgi:uncharacterized protein (TIGR02266 family)